MKGTCSVRIDVVAGHPHIAMRPHSASQTTSSEIMVRTPAPVRGSHQCCTSPSWNCRRAALRIWSRASFGSWSKQRQRVLQLVAEAEGAARLVEGRARTDAAGEALVGQPVVDHRVERLVRRLDLQRVEEAAPFLLVLGQPLVEILRRDASATSALASSRRAGVAEQPEQRHLAARRGPRRRARSPRKDRRRPRPCPTAPAPVGTACGSSTVPSLPDELVAVGRHRLRRAVGARKATRSPKSRL